jgi:hypothetical protein
VQHTIEQLKRGVIDFCQVFDQAAIGFMWNWVLMPKILSARVRQDESLVKTEEAMEVVRNATIESSLISIRVLDEFFATTPCRPGDIRAHHYLNYSSPGRFLNRQEFDSIGRRIAHLTVERSAEGAANTWKITDLISRACEPCESFLAFVVEGAGKQYLPGGDFDIRSRLVISRHLDAFMQRVLRASRGKEQHPAANVRFENKPATD